MTFLASLFRRWRNFGKAEDASAFVEFAIMIPTVATVVFASTEFSHTINRQSHFSLCAYSASVTFSSLGIQGESPEFDVVDDALNACLGNMTDKSKMRILCYRRHTLNENDSGELQLEFAYNALNGSTIGNNSALSVNQWAAPEIPDDHFGFNDGACVTHGCLESDPLNRATVAFGDVMSRLFNTFDAEYCTLNWARSNHVRVITSDNVQNDGKQSFNEVLNDI